MFDTPLLLDKPILILGLGSSGLACVRWCLSQGAHVQVVDTRQTPPELSALDALQATYGDKLQFKVRGFEADLIEGTQVQAVFKSPGLSPAQVSAVWQAAQTKGLWVGTELTLFNHALQALALAHHYEPKVLGITGTNGKTTVTALTGELVQRAGKAVAVAGNIGPTLLDTLSQAMLADALPQVWALELSSFQLDGVLDFSPTAATVLNLTEDHLDWHGSIQAYAAAKDNVYGGGAGQKPSPLGDLHKAHKRIDVVDQTPSRLGQYGFEEVAGMRWLVRAVPTEESLEDWQTAQDINFAKAAAKLEKAASKRTKSDVEVTAVNAEEPFMLQRLLPANALRIRGRHNHTNALAALALATRAGCGLSPMLYGLREYRGEPHRVQSLAVINDIEFIDDSKGTNVGATLAALESLGESDGGDRTHKPRLIVILGGDGKGQDFSPLTPMLAKFAKAVVLIGKDATRIHTAIANDPVCASLPVLYAQTLPEALGACVQQAVSGDKVLLSPACASMDMFKDYKHRAQVFEEAVAAIAQDAGGIA